ncbi:hypothetical protein AAG570_003652 [Ranatra chinensis]|uniref:Uncharacterized protein n=1 Tax=Ranatra chinensis TaxID=642074 RepID=A0ABD0YGR2_9HEMI
MTIDLSLSREELDDLLSEDVCRSGRRRVWAAGGGGGREVSLSGRRSPWQPLTDAIDPAPLKMMTSSPQHWVTPSPPRRVTAIGAMLPKDAEGDVLLVGLVRHLITVTSSYVMIPPEIRFSRLREFLDFTGGARPARSCPVSHYGVIESSYSNGTVGEVVKQVEDDPPGELKKAKLEVSTGYCTYLHDAYYYTWYEPWTRVNSAFRPWPTLGHIKEKSPILRDSVPTYLSRGPPVLLHPERVVPLSQSERFERSYQPNVALAPPNHKNPDSNRIELKTEEICDKEKRPTIRRHGTNGLLCNPEMELSSTDTDDSASEHLEPGSVVEQVAAVFDALSDAKETTRQRVIGLVESLANRISCLEHENRTLREQLGRKWT